MVRGYLAFIGVGLLLLWAAFLGNPVGPWVHWVDFLAGILCLASAGLVTPKTTRSVRTVVPFVLALSVFLVGIVTIQAEEPSNVQAWWNLGFSALLVLAGLAEASDFPQVRYMGPESMGRPMGRGAGYGSRDLYGAAGPYGWGIGPFYGMGYYGETDISWHGHSGRGPKSYQRSDERILEDANERLTHHWDIDATEIAVSVEHGIVTLQGSVESRRARRAAESVIESIIGVKDIHNEIELKDEITKSSKDIRGNEKPPMRVA